MKTIKNDSIVRTFMQRRYLINFGVRLSIFLIVLCVYLLKKEFLIACMTFKLPFGINPLHILWLGFMLMMLGHLRPKEIITMAWGKSRADNFQEVEGYDSYQLLKFVQDMNFKAWLVLLVWFCLNAIIGYLYV
ncbi:MAG: hypothetical protein Q4C49_08325 [Bacillota bacterium]|nr:hypothetical protein [Bacillota bacterium]